MRIVSVLTSSPALRLAGLLFALQSATPVLADFPAPPPLAREQLLMKQETILQQLAAPLQMGDGSALFFNVGSGRQAVRVYPEQPERNQIIKLDIKGAANVSDKPDSHGAAVSEAGAWLVGAGVELLRPDGRIIRGKLSVPRFGPRVVALADGSIMVVGGRSWPDSKDMSNTVRVERLWLDANEQIQSEILPPLPVAVGNSDGSSGYRLLHLGKGRVMLCGAKYYSDNFLYEPQEKRWYALPEFGQQRVGPALSLLPDGRVWATGGSSGNGGGNSGGNAASTSEIWNPASRKWTPGPDLPVPMIEHSSVMLNEAPGRKATVLLAGGYFPSVLAWHPGDVGDKPVLVAQHAMQRQGAALIPLSNNRLAVISGRRARPNSDESWGRRSEGMSIVPLDLNASGKRDAAWIMQVDGGVAEHKGQLIFAGGQLRHSFTGSEDAVSTRLLEVVQLGTGLVRSLPALPVAADKAQLAWLNDGELLLHAESGEGQDMQWLGVLNAKTGAFRRLPKLPNFSYTMSDGVHNRMRLIGAQAGRGWLVGENAQVLWVSAKGVEVAPRLQRQRVQFVGRVLGDGRAIVAGGEVESEVVAARPADCVNCAPVYIGFGPNLPARRYEIFNPGDNNWNTSAPSRGVGGSHAILADGRVIKAGILTEKIRDAKTPDKIEEVRRPLLELSNPNGTAWRTLPWPDGLQPRDGDSIQLKTVINEDVSGMPSPYGSFVFLGLPGNSNSLTQWYWTREPGAADLRWLPLTSSMAPFGFISNEVDLKTTTADGKHLFAIGGHAGVAVVARP
ncbi:hypothetical protein H8L32_16950 [Undibacterium sp. CY18W]|uniref:Uncharacterized protein n=1 Tax=Undibacterium hunanense TaxID=2762292 RepID=A0ABR6ZTG4_9BURK|nr:kelch repeat-containing protein [Undibacterium hunanense]MBC3919183.1 hypothetical protein [Undibacterium hunanense]